MNRLPQKFLFLFAITLVASLTGCMTAAQKLEKDAVDKQLHAGQTQADVWRILGRPVNTSGGANGKTLDEFVIITRAMPHTPPGAVFRTVCVLYNHSGHLEEFTWYEGKTMNSSNPFLGRVQSGHTFTASDLAHIKRNVTTRDEMIQRFGLPAMEGINAYNDKTMSWIHAEGHDNRLENMEALTILLNRKSVVTDYSLDNLK